MFKNVKYYIYWKLELSKIQLLLHSHAFKNAHVEDLLGGAVELVSIKL